MASHLGWHLVAVVSGSHVLARPGDNEEMVGQDWAVICTNRAANDGFDATHIICRSVV